MPELPEVETVRMGLIREVKGKKILKCVVRWNGIIASPSVEEFIRKIEDQTINDVLRRGKFLMFVLDDYFLISHLRMEGKYFIKKESEHLDKHDHVIFTLNTGEELRYNDTRKFGKMYLIGKDELDKSEVAKLGKEPNDSSLDVNYLKNKFNKKKAIKTLLLDQSIICGIGNIYADEILFLSKINPERYGYDLNDLELQAIIDNTRIILNKAIKMGGTTIHTYKAVNGITGMFQQELLVHGKKGEKCPACGNEIIKITVNTRGTYYCFKCQK